MKSRLKNLKDKYGFLFFAFIAPMLLMWMIYIAIKVYPFGNNSVLVLDLNGQYVYFYEELRQKLLEGGSLLYSWSRTLGGEFPGIIAYYVASPFALLTLLFPKNHMTEALLCIILLKTGSMGATMAYYLNYSYKSKKLNTIIFSTAYALSAYAVVQAHNSMWIDNLILLPLVVMGIEQLIKKRKFKLYTVSLALCLLTNFYIGYMMCLFVIVYFIYYYFSHNANNENNFYLETNHFWKSVGRIAVYSLIAICMAMIIVYPAYYSLQFGKTTFSTTKWSLGQNFDFLDMFTKFFPGSYDTVRPAGLPFVYCSTLALILLPIYFITSKIKAKERIGGGIILGFFVLFFNTWAIDIVWHGFQRPNWLNYRYSFMFIFLMIVMAYKAYANLEFTNYKYIAFIGGAYVLALMFIQKQDYSYISDQDCIWLSIGLICIYLVILYAEHRDKGRLKQLATATVAIVVFLELFIAGLLNTLALDKDVVISSRDSYVNYMNKMQPLVDYVKEYDTSPFYRMEKDIHRKTNDPMALDFNGISNSTSTLNASVIELLHELGYASKSHWTKYLGGTPVSDSLIGLKYLILEKDCANLAYEKIYTDEENGYSIYKNPYALSLGYGVNSAINDLEFSDYHSPFNLMNEMITNMLGSKDTIEVFKKMEVTSSSKNNLSVSFTNLHTKYTKADSDSSASLTFKFEVPAGVAAYMYLPTDYPRECSYRVNGKSSGKIMGNESDRIISLGVYDTKTTLTVEIVYDKEPFYIMNNEDYFYYIDNDTLDDAMKRLAESNLNITSFKDTKINGTVNMTDGKTLMFTTIPYDAGWHVKVDGQTVETVKTGNSLLAFNVGEGEHTIELSYLSDAFLYGSIITVGGVIAFAAAIVIDNAKRRRRNRLWAESNRLPD